MKKIFTILVASFMTASLFAQAQLPNASFESWTAGSPDAWGTYGSILPNFAKFATQDAADATDGTSSIILHSDTISSFPYAGQLNFGRGYSYNPTTHQVTLLPNAFTDKPDSIQFDIKYNPIGGDTCAVVCQFTTWNGTARTLVGGFDSSANVAMIFNSANAQWGRVKLPLLYKAGSVVDTMFLNFKSSINPKMANIGTTLKLDNVKLIYNSPNGILEEEIGATRVNLFPNPSTDFITFSIEDFNNATYEIVNINGAIVKNGTLTTNNEKVNITELANGNYFYKVIIGNKLYRGKFVATK